jgi:tetratricopeptide (TPR) repeat protein
MYQEAIAQFKEAVKIDSKFDLARENLKHVYNVSGITDADVQNWSARLDSDPKNVEYLLNLGASYYNVGRLEEAEDTLKRAAELEPSHYVAKMRLGNVLKAKGRYREALDHYLFVSSEMGKHPAYYTDLGEIYYNLGRSREAIAALKTAIEIDSGYWKPHFLISFAYGDEGQLDEASKESKIASELNPYFQNSEANLSLLEENTAAEAAGVYDNDLTNQECTSYLLGIAYKERGYLKEALAEFELALIEMPENEQLHAEIARLHLADGRLDEAASHLLKNLENDPENAAVHKILGCEHHVNGNLPAATAFYLEAFRLNSADPDILNNLGVLLYQTGLREDAERTFKKGLNRDLYHAQTNANVLVNYILKEDYPTADSFMQHYEKFAGDTPQYHEKRALFQFKMGKVNSAMEHVEKALAADAERSDALYLRGMIYLREDNLRDAVKSITEASKRNKRFIGLDLVLACSHRQSGEASVAADVSVEPSDEMIELLQAATNQGFEEIHDLLEDARKKAIEATEQESDSASAEDIEDDGERGDGLASGDPGQTQLDAHGDENAEKDGFEALDKMIEELKSL